MIGVRETVDALAALLRDQIAPPLNPDPADPAAGVHVSRAPDVPPGDSLGPHPHAVIHPSPGLTVPTLAGVESHRVWTVQVTCAGGTPTRALSAVDRVMAALDGARLPGAGLPQLVSSTPVALDPDPAYVVHFAVLVFQITLTA